MLMVSENELDLMKSESISKTEDKQVQDDITINGFNTRVYRILSIIFIALGVINVVTVLIVFLNMGYGLWRAENALSYVSKIDSNFALIDHCILQIELNNTDSELVSSNIDDVIAYYKEISDDAEKFRELNLKAVDTTIQGDFELVMHKVNDYYNSMYKNLIDVRNGKAEVGLLRNKSLESNRQAAVDSLHTLFEKTDKSTYDFFYSTAQSFLLVPIFLIITMSAGLYAIHRFKKRNIEYVVKLQESKKKTESARQKVVELAYTDMITGLRNKYALFEEVEKRLEFEEVSLVLYDYCNFDSIYSEYGREYADDFMENIAKRLNTVYGDEMELFSIENNELCVLFKHDLLQSKKNIEAQKIMYAMSEQAQVKEAQIQLIVAGCICHCRKGSYTSINEMFKAMDKKLIKVKFQSLQNNCSMVASL